MVLQSVAAPLPAFVITIVNGLLFGALWGGLLSWSSAMVGAALCYAIARALGRPVVERLVGARPLAKSDAIFERYGTHAVLIARLIPLISFDVVSYAAGLTSIGFLPFLVATGIGQLPATVVYSLLGQNIGAGPRVALWTVSALASLVVLGLALRGRVERRLAQRPVAVAG
ncbi:MAG TPA: TVP38/TMEM64 family protein [Chloroflexota bacterium]|nr:TVP38/TMEM64 family protein [Chloroflexota bacterium]